MSVIKSGDLAASVSVRPLAAARQTPPSRRAEPFVDPELLALRREVESLSGELEARDSLIAGHGAELDKARREGEADGRKAGLKEADDGRAQSAAALRQGLELALQRYGEEIAALERLAPLLALAGLEKILGEDAGRAELLAAAIRRQIETLGGQALVRIEVSPVDFPDSETLRVLATAAGRPAVEVTASEALDAGGCRIKLRLGALEVGVGQQWDSLRAALEEMAAA